ncbi:MAG: hypothetical protein J0I60_01650 [Nitrosospira sp.]|nr:hypothetical protein [Nitrosospira sp.]
MFENLSYAIMQLVHNFGAAAVVGVAIFAIYPAAQPIPIQRKFAWLVGLSWTAQALSGVGFGAVSYYFYEKLPDLYGLAFAALLIKIMCAAGGVSIAIMYLRQAAGWTTEQRSVAWKLLAALGVTALAAAAFLRWFA